MDQPALTEAWSAGRMRWPGERLECPWCLPDPHVGEPSKTRSPAWDAVGVLVPSEPRAGRSGGRETRRGAGMTVTGRRSSAVVWHTLRHRRSCAAPRRRRQRAGRRTRPTHGWRHTGRTRCATEPPPSLWVVARAQLSNPMNIMLVIVAVASFAIGQVATGIFVALLVTFNVVMGIEPGAEGAGERRRAGAAAGAARPGAACRARRGGRRRSTSCPATSCCSRRATWSRPTAGSSRRRRSRCRRPRSPARARPSPKDAHDAAAGETSRSATARTWCSRTRRSRAARRRSW